MSGPLLRILIVTGIFPPDIGGPASYVSTIAARLAARGHRITVLTLSDQPEYGDEALDFQVARISRQWFKPLRWLITLTSTIRLGRQADVVFVNGLAMEAAFANLLLRKPMAQKVVGDLAWEQARNRGWTKDELETFQTERYGVRLEALKLLRTWWTRRAHRVIVPSRYLARVVHGWGVAEKEISVIYNASESGNGTAPVAVPLEGTMKLVTVGRLVSWKRVDAVIEAVAQSVGTGLIIVGDGPEREPLEKLARHLGIAERVHFAGPRSRTEVLGLMAACDVFVLNSTYEGLPHVVLEAMSLGLPVVATAVGGTPEVVESERNGLLIQPDQSALVQTLKRLQDDPKLRRKLGCQGQATVREMFDIETMVEKTENVLVNADR